MSGEGVQQSKGRISQEILAFAKVLTPFSFQNFYKFEMTWQNVFTNSFRIYNKLIIELRTLSYEMKTKRLKISCSSPSRTTQEGWYC